MEERTFPWVTLGFSPWETLKGVVKSPNEVWPLCSPCEFTVEPFAPLGRFDGPFGLGGPYCLH